MVSVWETPLTATETQQAILDTIATVFRNKGLEAPPLTLDTPFDRSLGLESLDFAEIVVRLEERLGYDPFAEGTEWQIRTIGDLAGMYRK